VYYSKEIDFTWDGRFHEERMQPGVYVYVITVDFVVNGLQRHTVLSGDITLVR